MEAVTASKLEFSFFFAYFLLSQVMFCSATYTPCRDATECDQLTYFFCDTGLEVCVHCSGRCSLARLKTASQTRRDKCELECADYMNEQRKATTSVPTTIMTQLKVGPRSSNLKATEDSGEALVVRYLVYGIAVVVVTILVLQVYYMFLRKLCCKPKLALPQTATKNNNSNSSSRSSPETKYLLPTKNNDSIRLKMDEVTHPPSYHSEHTLDENNEDDDADAFPLPTGRSVQPFVSRAEANESPVPSGSRTDETELKTMSGARFMSCAHDKDELAV